MAQTAGSIVSGGLEFARDHPEAALAVVAGLLALVALGYAIKRFRRPNGVRFLSLLADRDAIAVLTHPNPDPDAMAAAMGVSALARQVGTDATIQYTGGIRHQENRAFRTVLDLDLEPVDHVSDIVAEDVVLVDHNEPRGFAGADAVLPIAVVDHHPGDGVGEAFTDVRTEYGASSSIVAEYFQNVGAVPVPPDQHASEVGTEYTLSSGVATGLLYGVLTDTKHLTQGASEADFAASGYLYPGVDEDLLDRIANPQVSAEVLEAKARAIAGRQVEGSFAVSDIGTLSNADAVPQAADELMQLEGLTAVVVCAECGDTIYLSGRSRDDRVHMGHTLEEVVETVPGATAGGHARMGGGQIPQQSATDGGETVPDHGHNRSALVDRLFRALGGET